MRAGKRREVAPAAQQAEQQRRPDRLAGAQDAADDPVLDKYLQRLRRFGRKLPPALDRTQIVGADHAPQQRLGENVRRRHRVLDRQVDADPADRRHRVGRVADAQQPRPMPYPQAVDRHAQQLDVVPVAQFGGAVAQVRGEPGDFIAESRQAALLNLGIAALGNDIGALPIVFAVQHHQDATGVDTPQGLRRIVGPPRQPHPQHVHRRAEIVDGEPGLPAHRRMAAIGADDEIGANGQMPLRRFDAHAGNPAALLDEADHLGSRHQPKRGVAATLLGDEIEKIPLRHQGEEAAMGGQMGKIGDFEKIIADLRAEAAGFLMRPAQELGEQAELVHDLEGRGMDRVAAEIAQKVGVLFEHQDRNAGAGQQQPEHHSGGSTSGDAATNGKLAIGHREFPICASETLARNGAFRQPCQTTGQGHG